MGLWKWFKGKKRHFGAAVVIAAAVVKWILKQKGIEVPDIAEDPTAVLNLVGELGGGVYTVGILDRLLRKKG